VATASTNNPSSGIVVRLSVVLLGFEFGPPVCTIARVKLGSPRLFPAATNPKFGLFGTFAPIRVLVPVPICSELLETVALQKKTKASSVWFPRPVAVVLIPETEKLGFSGLLPSGVKVRDAAETPGLCTPLRKEVLEKLEPIKL